ncbi:BMP family ABC transporter substrate-binding protein [Rhodobacteraceae bacterium 2CG4]|uniref:BMP family ABC transporter substrate-binding protein n=1 Tax=Halovulum marinum TaxID=2662447 RepID=A0A6L5YZ22_9RHOB|nr:BMP family ABC transporter substrate-binding protein [Halovulum marinum]MSU89546.1 BMP family ABC transporter substrate-binding protein [Halovulum marinum]
MKIVTALLGAAVAFAATTAAFAQDFKPAVIFDLGGKFDRSFNQASFEGAERFKEEFGVDYREFEIQSDAQREQALRRFAQQGNNPIVVAGFAQASAMEAVAAEFPDTDFTIIDAVIDLPNVRSVVFKEHEGSYLVGMLAAMASESGTVGFVGGMDIGLIRKFACGYVQGVKAVNPDATVIQNMTGTTGAAWNDPVKGGELARNQIDQGADVVYHAAGGTGRGVLQAAADNGALGIGVDSNQNYLHPGEVLTSMLKRVDVAVYDAFKDAQDGNFSAGVQVLGLAENGVGYAVDENNEDLLTDEMKTAVEDAKAKIISGEIEVHDYTTDDSCPVS